MKKSRLLGAVCAVTLAITVLPASAATFNVLNGTFQIFDYLGVFLVGTPLIGNGVLEEGVFNGSAASVATDSSATFAGFETAILPLGTEVITTLDLYYAATGTDGLTHSAPTIDFAAMTADMGSMYASFAGTSAGEFNLGALATVTQTGTGMWELNWSRTLQEGPFAAVPVVMSMTISEVPIPPAVWLFGSGLLGLVGVARRKKAA
jgi:hypothetical protein